MKFGCKFCVGSSMGESTSKTALLPPWEWLKNRMQALLCFCTGESIAAMKMVGEEQDQPKKVEETLEEDRISALPDCLILQILSLLPSTKDAIRTSTLSKRWKCLWTSVPTLIFEQKLVLHSRKRPTFDFVSLVNKTLTQCSHSKLHKFEVFIQYDLRFESHVNDWIRYAISCKVEKLSLTLWSLISEAEFLLPEEFFINSCFTDMRLSGFIFNPIGAVSWKMLRSLCICYAYLDEELIENILSGSPVLETLQLDYCYGYRRLDITSKSVKNLVFCGYHNPTDDFYDADVIEINAPNVSSLKILCDLLLWKILLLDVSSLVEAELDCTKLGYWETTQKKAKEEMLKGFIQSLHHVKELKIGMYCFKVLARLVAEGFPFPSNMKFPDINSP